MKGKVLKSTGKWYKVLTENNETVQAQLKGKIRLLDLNLTNPIAVGDEVFLEKTDSDTELMISGVAQRQNYIVRVSPKKKSQRQIIASNIDQAVLVVTMQTPRTSTGFIDRFLLTAEAYHIPTIIVFNKQDILKTKAISKQNELIDLYENLGYKTLQISATEKTNIDTLKTILKNKTTLLSGHSGVGKSTLVNAIAPHLQLKTKDISKKFNKGVHTTTHAEMHPLPFGGNIIDVPGIKEFGIAYLDKYELSHYFVEMKALLSHCKFSDCLHIEEPHCAIKKALENQEIHPERYFNYLNILDSLEESFL